MRNAGLEEAQAGIKIARRNINHLRYADLAAYVLLNIKGKHGCGINVAYKAKYGLNVFSQNSYAEILSLM